jgi:hypothetical protein
MAGESERASGSESGSASGSESGSERGGVGKSGGADDDVLAGLIGQRSGESCFRRCFLHIKKKKVVFGKVVGKWKSEKG